MDDDLAVSAVDSQIEQHEIGNRVVVPIVAGNFLVVPDQLSGRASNGNDAVRIKVIAGAAMHVRPRAGLTGAHVNDVVVTVIGHAVPYGAAAADVPPLVAPGFCGSFQGRIFE